MAQTKTSDKIGKSIFAAAAVISIISVVAIFGFLIAESIPALNKIGRRTERLLTTSPSPVRTELPT